MFFKRSYEKEIMDDLSIQDERIDKALNELAVINKFLGGYSVTEKGIKYFTRNNSVKLKILDAGSGLSEVLLSLEKKYFHLDLFSLDMNKRACLYAKHISPNLNIVCGNVLNLPFKNNSFDIVHASLFLHHFNEEEMEKILNSFNEKARLGIVINDLRRSVLAFAGIKILTWLFSKNSFVKNDGPLSVKRSFLKKEIKQLLSELHFKKYNIKRMWAFRWLIIINS